MENTMTKRREFAATAHRWVGRKIFEYSLPLALGAAALTIHAYLGILVSRASEFTLSESELSRWGIAGGPISTLDDSAVRIIGEHARRDSGIKRVAQVRRAFPAEIAVHVQTRSPWIAVRTPQEYFTLDDDAVQLGCGSRTVPPTRTGLVLTGISGPGWNTEEIRAGFELARLVVSTGALRDLVSEIDLSNLGGRRSAAEPHVVFATRSGCRLHWGSPTDADGFEPTLQEKLDNLAAVTREYPSLAGLDYAKIYIRNRPTVKRSRPAGPQQS